jgi:hypothetical protein
VKDVLAEAELEAERLINEQSGYAQTDIKDAKGDGGPGDASRGAIGHRHAQ